MSFPFFMLLIRGEEMDKYKCYKEYKQVIDDYIVKMMQSKMVDINSLKQLENLMEMSYKIDHCLKEWEKNNSIMESEMIMKDTLEPVLIETKTDMYQCLSNHYKKYIEYKKSYHNTGSEECKHNMMEHLKKAIEYQEQVYNEMKNNRFDSNEEIVMIKTSLQNIYQMIK